MDLYKNAGEMTKRCVDEIVDGKYSFLTQKEEYTEEYLKDYPFHSFSDGLTESIVKHGFAGDTGSVEEKTAFVKEKYEKKNIPLNVSNIRRWFIEKRPLSNSKSRELVYQFCFAMEMNLKEATEFFLKVYFECPFNFRISEEVIYYFCFANGLEYSAVQNLKEKAYEILKQAEPEESGIEITTAIGAELKNVHTEEDLLQYISENSAEFLVNNRTAFFYANELLNECTDLAKKFFDFENEWNFSEEKNTHHAEKKQNVDLFLYMLFGIDLLQYKKEKSFAKACAFPDLVKSNFPLKMQLSRIRNNEPVSYDTMRKALIMLEFYAYFASLFYNFEIQEVVGMGASCIVYTAVYTDSEQNKFTVRLKEFFPDSLNICRKNDILVIPEESISRFEKNLSHFTEGYKRQLIFRSIPESQNSISNIQGIFEGNNTKYIAMNCQNGIRLDKADLGLYDAFRVLKAVTLQIQNFHNNEWLYLDLKPENVILYPETPELVMLFDFDSAVGISDIQPEYISLTKSWSAPEVVQRKTDSIGIQSDVYAIGALLMFLIFCRSPSLSDRRKRASWDFENSIIAEEIPELKRMVTELFKKTLNADVNSRYTSCQQILDVIEPFIRSFQKQKPYLKTILPMNTRACSHKY